MSNTRKQLQNFIETELLNVSTDTLDHDEELLAGGLIDSLAVMRLVDFLEKTSGTVIPPEDITVENFATVTTIAGYFDANHGEPRP